MWKKTLLLDDAPADGGSNPPKNPASAGDSPAPAAPPAAETVLEGDHTERELKLQEELQHERTDKEKALAEKKERETKIAELEDQLSHAHSSPAPAAAKKDSWESDIFEL